MNAPVDINHPFGGMSPINDFCRRNQVGRSFAYEQIRDGKLIAVKVGAKTCITYDAELASRDEAKDQNNSPVEPSKPVAASKPRREWSKPYIYVTGPCVYIVSVRAYVKIGRSDNFEGRFKDLQTGIPEHLTVHDTIPEVHSRDLERRLHERFRDYRLHGEWFRREGELAAWIDAGCAL